MKKKCGHEEVCVECTKAEIAKLENKVRELRRKLPADNSSVLEPIAKLSEKKDYALVPYPTYPPLQYQSPSLLSLQQNKQMYGGPF